MDTWQVPGYREIDSLGSGGFGRVALARHEVTGGWAAIKYLHATYLSRADILESFHREAWLLSHVHSPHVAAVYGFERTQDGAALIMEAVPGVPLSKILTADGTLLPESALAVLKGSLLGLAAAHDVGVVHRDYKPANVLVTAERESKLVDFGLAALDGHAGLSAGTPAYMAPEQWAGRPGTPATDVYAATCVFYRCVTGSDPYQAGATAELKVLHEHAPLPLEHLPPQLHALVRHGMAKDPAQRPATASDFVAELQEAATDAYGDDWEERGWQRLAAGVSTLAALTPVGVLLSTSTAAAPTAAVGAGAGGGMSVLKAVAVGATVLGLVAGGAVTYNQIDDGDTTAAEEQPAPQEEVEPAYAYTTETSFGVGRGEGESTEFQHEVRHDVVDGGDSPRFTADGEFAFSTADGQVRVIAVDTGEQQTLSCGPCQTAVPAGGSEIAWATGVGLHVVDLAGPGDGRDVPIELSGGGGIARVLAAGDGRLLVSDAAPTAPPAGEGENLYLVDADGGDLQDLGSVDSRMPVSSAAISPDGGTVAYVVDPERGRCHVMPPVVTVDTESGNREQATPAEGQPGGPGTKYARELWFASDGVLHGTMDGCLDQPDDDVDGYEAWRLDGQWEPAGDEYETAVRRLDDNRLLVHSEPEQHLRSFLGAVSILDETTGERVRITDEAVSRVAVSGNRPIAPG